MKKTLFIICTVLPMLIVAQRKPKIKGNRSVIEVRESLPAFNAIELMDDLDIELKKSFEEGYEITADDNLIDVLKFKVQDSTLIISSFYTIMAKKKLEIVVNIKNLTMVTLHDGKIESDDIISTDEIHIRTAGPSKVKLKASGFMASLNMEDNSYADLNLDVDSLQLNMKHRSDAKIYSATGEKVIQLQENASLDIAGSTTSLDLMLLGSSRYKGEKMQAENVKVLSTGSSLARIYAARQIDLQSQEDAKTYLYGEPKIIIEEFTGTSQLLKKKSD
ncbi:MAG: DUF2807 domain-containing protein [Croceitalea sp.]|nr:DUF2807 domain-containing protein [Croceitalea sp.]